MSEFDTTFQALIVGMDPSRIHYLQSLLGGFEVESSLAKDLEEAHQISRKLRPAIVFLDAAEIPRAKLEHYNGLRAKFGGQSLLVAIANGRQPSESSLLMGDVDIVLHDPAQNVDMARNLAMADAFQSSPEAPDRYREQFRKLPALRQLSVEAARHGDARAALPSLLELGHQILGVTAVAVWEPTDDDGLSCAASSGLSAHFIKHVEERTPGRGQAIIDLVKTWYPVSNVTAPYPPCWQLVDPTIASTAGLGMIANLPTRSGTTVHGILSIYCADDASYDLASIPLANALASLVATVLNADRRQHEVSIAEQFYRDLVEHSPIGVLVCDTDGRIELANMALASNIGRPLAQLFGANIRELFLRDQDIPWDIWRRETTNHSQRPATLRMHGPGGRALTVECHGRAIQLPLTVHQSGSNHMRIHLVIQDVTTQHRRLHELQLLHDLTHLVSVKENIDAAFQIVALRLVRDLGYRIAGIALASRDGKHFEGHGYHRDIQAFTLNRFTTDSGITGRVLRENLSIMVPDVSRNPDYLEFDPEVRSELAVVIRSDGKPVGVIDIQSDAMYPLGQDDLALAESIAVHLGLLLDRLQAAERLEREATTDPLTGFANRRLLMERLVSLADDLRVETAALFLIDLDGFKQINDQFGHLYGDAVLRLVAVRLAGCVRPGDLLARYGGDELALLILNADFPLWMEIGERILQTVASQPFETQEITASLTASVGIAVFRPLDRTDPDELIARADRAMYAAKLAGGNTIRHDPEGC